MPQSRNKKLLAKIVRKGKRGFPIATVACYGSDNSCATKMVCGIIKYENAEAEPMQKWFTDGDARKSEKILGELIQFIDGNKAKSVTMLENIIGCPHEEGIDYPEGTACPECPYWKNRDRFTHEVIH
jgi:hypothetical protein